MFAAMKAGNTVEKEILRVAVGEITTEAARAGQPASDEEIVAILRKLIKANRESLEASEDAEQRATLEREIEILSEIVPKVLDQEGTIAALQAIAPELRAAAGDGPATGIAMRHLKAASQTVDGRTVAAAVQAIRKG